MHLNPRKKFLNLLFISFGVIASLSALILVLSFIPSSINRVGGFHADIKFNCPTPEQFALIPSGKARLLQRIEDSSQTKKFDILSNEQPFSLGALNSSEHLAFSVPGDCVTVFYVFGFSLRFENPFAGAGLSILKNGKLIEKLSWQEIKALPVDNVGARIIDLTNH